MRRTARPATKATTNAPGTTCVTPARRVRGAASTRTAPSAHILVRAASSRINRHSRRTLTGDVAPRALSTIARTKVCREGEKQEGTQPTRRQKLDNRLQKGHHRFFWSVVPVSGGCPYAPFCTRVRPCRSHRGNGWNASDSWPERDAGCWRERLHRGLS